MPRPFKDITTAISTNPIKNGTLLTNTTPTGQTAISNKYVKNTPTIETIQNKYGNKFYNGIFVNVISGDLNGGTSL
jgi:hypothetical protein